MAMLNPPGYLHNATPAVATGQMDRLISIMSHVAANASGLTVMEGVRGYTDMQVTANGTPNMSVNVAAGVAIIDGTRTPHKALTSLSMVARSTLLSLLLMLLILDTI
jgi:hypothetical protein